MRFANLLQNETSMNKNCTYKVKEDIRKVGPFIYGHKFRITKIKEKTS